MHHDSYDILAAPVSAELKVKGSRFLAFVIPIRDESEAARSRARLVDRHADASHHCWALRLGHPRAPLERHSDAGEPAGSAGPPIARALLAAGLSDLICVVIRWFGGSKLGIGGLIRAYGDTARLALQSARHEERLLTVQLSGELGYEHEPAMRTLVERLAGHILESHHGENVSWTLALPPSALAEFDRRVADMSRGEVQFRIAGAGEKNSRE